jgi:hypothetical protein
MKTIAQHWAHYFHMVYPQGASELQRDECQQAFYGGAATALETVLDVLNSQTEESAIPALRSVETEIETFLRDRAKRLNQSRQ